MRDPKIFSVRVEGLQNEVVVVDLPFQLAIN